MLCWQLGRNFQGRLIFKGVGCFGDAQKKFSRVGVRVPVQDYKSLRIAGTRGYDLSHPR